MDDLDIALGGLTPLKKTRKWLWDEVKIYPIMTFLP